MRRRVPLWAGSIVALAAAAGLAVYLVRVGLDDADKPAGVIGLFVAVAGLGVAGYELATGRSPELKQEQLDGPSTSGQPSIAVQGGNAGIVSTGAGATNVQLHAHTSEHGRVHQSCCRWRRCGRSPRWPRRRAR
ncbi:hypothetical protein [Nonomuraea angiospora]